MRGKVIRIAFPDPHNKGKQSLNAFYDSLTLRKGKGGLYYACMKGSTSKNLFGNHPPWYTVLRVPEVFTAKSIDVNCIGDKSLEVVIYHEVQVYCKEKKVAEVSISWEDGLIESCNQYSERDSDLNMALLSVYYKKGSSDHILFINNKFLNDNNKEETNVEWLDKSTPCIRGYEDSNGKKIVTNSKYIIKDAYIGSDNSTLYPVDPHDYIVYFNNHQNNKFCSLEVYEVKEICGLYAHLRKKYSYKFGAWDNPDVPNRFKALLKKLIETS